MLNEKRHDSREHFRENYLPAALYLQSQLGAGAGKYADELRRLSYTDDLDSLKKQIDRWQAAAPVISQQPAVSGDGCSPQAEPRPSFKPIERWEPCFHYGGTRPCSTCLKEQQSEKFAAEQKARMELVAGWYKPQAEGGYREWVWKRVHAELIGKTKLTGSAYEAFCKDIHALCWVALSQQAGQYQDAGLKHGCMAWMKSVVRGVVKNYFRDQFRQCRDVRKETVLPEDDTLVAPWEPMDAQPTVPSGSSPEVWEH